MFTRTPAAAYALPHKRDPGKGKSLTPQDLQNPVRDGRLPSVDETRGFL